MRPAEPTLELSSGCKCAAVRLVNVLELVLAACQSAGSTADLGTIEAEILKGYEGIILDAEYVAAHNFLIVAVSSGTTQFGAKQIA